ncbi:MAG: phosphatase PAP2 family protein [Pseudomonadota bacterium]|nr:phosphatase PAP2 family protein [Pseudomonadota bacterium]
MKAGERKGHDRPRFGKGENEPPEAGRGGRFPAESPALLTASRKEILLFTLLVAAAVVAAYLYLDLPVARAARELPFRTGEFFQRVTALGEATWPLIVAALLALAARFLWRRDDWMRRSLFVFTAVAAAGLTTDLLKWLAGRWRPKAYFTDGFYGFDLFGVGYEQTSFPSGHATTIWACGVALAILFPRWRFLWYALAILVSMSRVIIGAHYLGDVLAGAYVAVVTTLALVRLRYFRLGRPAGET